MQLATNDVTPSDPQWSPDGTQIVFVGTVENGSDLYTIAPDGSGLTRITDDAEAEQSPRWSPNSSQIAFVREASEGSGALLVMQADGSAQTQLATDLDAAYPIWSPEGQQLAFVSGKMAYTVTAAGGDPVQVT